MATMATATDLHPAWADRFNAGDLDGMLALAEPNSGFVPQPGTLLRGDDYRTGRAVEAVAKVAARDRWTSLGHDEAPVRNMFSPGLLSG